MKAKLDERKAKVLTIITVCFFIILVISASFAYFQVQVGNGASTSINATTGTTDVLTFLTEDLDVNKNNVIDENEEEDVVINASEDNFGINGKSLGDGVKAKARLTANNANNIAKMQKYNLFIVIDSNEIEYTQGITRPELIMKVTNPEGKEVKDIPGLVYHDAEEGEANDISGFDITGRTGGFAIKRDQEIEVTKEQIEHYTEQEWQIEIILINLKGNQNENGGNSVNGRILITSEDEETYKLAHVNSVEKYDTTKDSISGKLNYTEGTSKIKEYWYKIRSLGKNEASPILIEKEEYALNEEGANFNFTGLDENTKYEISSYVVDEYGFKSEIYTTTAFKTESGEEAIVTDRLPIIKRAIVSGMKIDRFRVEILDVEKGTNEIKEYSYHISGGEIDKTYTSENTYYDFTELKAGQQYKVEIKVIDTKKQESPKYDIDSTETTTDTLPEIEKVEATTVEANRLKFTITTKLGSNKITSYRCILKQGETEKGTKDGIITNDDTSEATCDFTGLETETEYTLEVTITDEHNNPPVEGEGKGTTIYNPAEVSSITPVEVEKGAKNLKFNITGTKGSYEIRSYSCVLKEGTNEAGKTTGTVTSGNNYPATCSFSNLKPSTTYTVEVKAIDEREHESEVKSESGTTLEIGTKENPYEIQAIEDLVELSNNVNKGNTYAGKYFELTRDLDFQKNDSYRNYQTKDYGDINGNSIDEELKTELTTGSGFKPIGNTQAKYFGGIFDGKENTLSNIYQNNTVTPSGPVGLFGTVNGATIKNLTLTGTNTSTVGFDKGGIIGRTDGTTTLENLTNNVKVSNSLGSNSTGGVVGANGGNTNLTIKNSKNTAEISGGNNVGGIVGYTNGVLNITGSTNSGTITNNLGANSGGILGRDNSSTNETNITQCTNRGEIKMEKNSNTSLIKAGGLVGHINGTINIDGSSNENTINVEALGTSGCRVGGIIGGSASGNYLTIKNSKNIKAINTSCNANLFEGGLVGISNAVTTIKNSSNSGAIVSSSINIDATGGIIGYLYTYDGFHEYTNVLENANNTGNLSANNNATAVGGLIGDSQTKKLIINKCYNIGNMSGMFGHSGGLIGSVYSRSTETFVPYIYIINSYNSSNMITSAGNNNGGFIGNFDTQPKQSIYLYNSGNLGDVNATGSNRSRGYVGTVKGDITINNAFSLGTLSGTSTYGLFASNTAYASTFDIKNAYYRSEYPISNVNVTATPMTLASMQNANFVTTLNNNVNSLNSVTADGKAYTLCKWKSSTNGPILDFTTC